MFCQTKYTLYRPPLFKMICGVIADNALPVFFHLSCYGMHVKIVYRICFSQMLSHSLCLSLMLVYTPTLHTHTHTPVVIIMIAAVVHYASKRCGSYTVNPDPEKKSNGTPSWISVVQSSSSPSAPATNHYANGHSNGHSYRTKSFRASSPTCSTNSFT